MSRIKYRDLDKERELLSILVKSKRVNRSEVFAKIAASTFTTWATRELFLALKDYHERYFAPINPQIAKSLVDELQPHKKRKLLNLLKAITKLDISSKTINYLIEELVFHESSRDVQKMLITAKDIFTQEGSPYLVKDFLFDAITRSQIRQQREVEVVDFRTDFKERYKQIKKMKSEGITHRGIVSGIDHRFDDETSGYCPGDLIIFVGQVAGGKSLAMQDQAVFIAVEQGDKVAYITNEMTARQVAFRMDSRISEVRHEKFKHPTKFKSLDFQKWKVSMEDLKKDRLKIIGMTGGNCSAAAVDNKLDEIGFTPDIVFLDYVNNMTPNNAGPRDSLTLDWQPQGQILRDCKNLGLKRKIPIVSAGQLKPEAYDKEEISPDDIAINKQALLTNSDVLVAIVQTKSMKLRNPPRARIQFIKVREGKTREYIEVIPNFGIIRLHDPRKKKAKKGKKGA